MTQTDATTISAIGNSDNASTHSSTIQASPETKIVAADPSQPADAGVGGRGDVSAVTVARMMGLATLGEVKMIESKVELLTTKLGSVQVKLEKIFTVLQGIPSGADLERIDIHIGALKQMLKEFLGDKASGAPEGEAKKPSSKIVTN